MSEYDKYHCSDQVRKLQEKGEKVERRTDYLKAQGYEVDVRVEYVRTRKVRAMDPHQAMDFAETREARYAPKSLHGQNVGYFVRSVEALEAREIVIPKKVTEEE